MTATFGCLTGALLTYLNTGAGWALRCSALLSDTASYCLASDHLRELVEVVQSKCPHLDFPTVLALMYAPPPWSGRRA